MHRGEVGVAALNEKLQEALNPPSPQKPERRLGGRVYRQGDRVMQIRNNYDKDVFNGDMDEVRISNVTRSANWIKMEYENQKPLQTLIGSLVPDGSTFSVLPASVTMNEGTTTTLTAQAGGAQKVYWIYKRNGVESVLATDDAREGARAFAEKRAPRWSGT